MICARCNAETPKSPCSQCGASPYLAGRYRLEERLRQGASSATYRALEIMGRQRVMLTEYALQGELTDEHEAGLNQVFAQLASIEHRGVATIVESFRGDSVSEPAWWVAQAWVDGAPLAERIERGPTDESIVLDKLDELLTVVAAFHMAGMPHGNVGPDTVVERSDGSLMLGMPSAIADYLLTNGLGGDESQPAWAAPEEESTGPSTVADMHRIGVVAASLLAGRAARHLRVFPTGVTWDGKQNIAPAVAALLDELTLENPAKRAQSTGQALAALQSARENPASMVGITSSWEEYTPDVTPPPAPTRPEAAQTPTPLDPALAETVEDLPPSVLPGPVTPDTPPPRRPRPSLGTGPLPIGMPEPLPQPASSSSSGMLLGIGCAALLLLSLMGGVGLGGVAMLRMSDGQTAATVQTPASPEPVVADAPEPVPVSPEPEAVAPAAPAPVVMPTDGPENPDMGLVRIRCERRVLVAINGRVVDRTPLDIELLPGEYELTATFDAMPDWLGRRVVTLTAGELEEVRFDP